MKKGMLLNSEVSYLISKLGHTDQLTIADAGLPIPNNVQRIDLALTANIPSFIETLKIILMEMHIEHIILASEIIEKNPEVLSQIQSIKVATEEKQGSSITIEYVTHEAFKILTSHSKGIIRTGECSPYANIILQSGVAF